MMRAERSRVGPLFCRMAMTLLVVMTATACIDPETFKIPDCNKIEPDQGGDWSENLVGTWWNLEPKHGAPFSIGSNIFFVFEPDGSGEYHSYQRDPIYAGTHGTFTWEVSQDEVLTMRRDTPTDDDVATMDLSWAEGRGGPTALGLVSIDPESEGNTTALSKCEPVDQYPE